MADLRDALKLGLSDGASDEAKGKVSDLASQIHALRDGNAVEVAPERTARKAARAERPVTSRIRERLASQELQTDSEGTGDAGQEETSKPVEKLQEVRAKIEAQSTAEVIPLQMTNLAEEKPEDVRLGDPFMGASGIVNPALHQERRHAERVAKRRQGDGQLRLF